MSYYNWEEITAQYTDTELIEVVKGSRDSPKDKVKAALNELKKRGIDPDRYMPPARTGENGAPDEQAPTLYSDRVIYTFSVLFSVVFGGILLAMNLKEVGKKRAIYGVISFSILYAAFSIYLLNALNSSSVGTILMNGIGAVILNEVFWRKYIGKETVYHKRVWLKPLIIALVITIPLVLLLIWGNSLTATR